MALFLVEEVCFYVLTAFSSYIRPVWTNFEHKNFESLINLPVCQRNLCYFEKENLEYGIYLRKK